jgi:predicted metal-dependent hydrolase
MAAHDTAAGAERPEVEIRRSDRRRRTVSAFRENGRVVICLPARLSPREQAVWVERMLVRLAARERRAAPTDASLQARAEQLSARYLDGRPQPLSVRWVSDQRHRWGSCTSADGTIRLSRRLAGMPAWVIDYVLVHELAHLLADGHDAAFWAWVGRYPQAERARGFLDGVSYSEASEPSPPGDSFSGSQPGSGPAPDPPASRAR